MLILNVMQRVVPEQYRAGDSYWESWIARQKKKDATPSGFAVAVGFIGPIAVGVALFVYLGDWSIWARIGLTVVAFFAILLSAVSVSTSINEREVEANYRRARAEWERSNSGLVTMVGVFKGYIGEALVQVTLSVTEMEEDLAKMREDGDLDDEDDDDDEDATVQAPIARSRAPSAKRMKVKATALELADAPLELTCLIVSPSNRGLVDSTIALHGTAEEKTIYAQAFVRIADLLPSAPHDA
ncbi:MAG: hypothetical protein ACHREM_01750 [Polyangiales bacterium]